MRAILVVLACLSAVPVDAKTLVVVSHARTVEAGVDQIAIEAAGRNVARVLDKIGKPYTVISGSLAKTEFCRTGTMVWNYGQANAYAEQFDAVIHVGGAFNSGSSRAFAAYRPESLTLTPKLPTVPQLFLVSLDQSVANSTVCSTGVTKIALNPHIEQDGSSYMVGTPWLWSNYGPNTIYRAASPLWSYGHRPIIAQGWSCMGLMDFLVPGAASIKARSGWKDSTNVNLSDSLVMWKVTNERVTGAKPNIFLSNFMSASGFEAPDHEIDLTMLLCGLAALDSAAGGAVLDKNKLPIKFGITIDGGFSRGRSFSAGGMDPMDDASGFMEASVESLEYLGVPIVVGVNVDSVRTYADDIALWSHLGANVRFAPQQRAGLDSAEALNNGNASWYRPRDVWGRYRNRSFYRNTDCTSAADTSLNCLLRASYRILDSTFGAGRVSRFAMAPDDDWSPHQVRGTQNAALVDSIIYAATMEGVNGFRINGFYPEANPSQNPINPLGYINTQSMYRLPSGRRVPLLAHVGFNSSGASALMGRLPPDTATGALGTWYSGEWYYRVRNAWAGALMDGNKEYNRFQDGIGLHLPIFSINSFYSGRDSIAGAEELSNTRLRPTPKGNVLRMHVSDFGSGGTDQADRPGWWFIKHIVYQAWAINKLANRNIVDFVWPEEIKP